MKKTLLALLLLTGCAKGLPNSAVPPILFERPSIQLFTPYGFGHGCPVEGIIFTARHLVEPRPEVSSGATLMDRTGAIRPARLIGISWANDTAGLEPMNAQLDYYPMRGGIPHPGEEIYWWEYVLLKGPDVFRPKLKSARFLRTAGGHLILDRSPVPGASGSCAFDRNGQVLGIIVWGNPDLDFAIVAPLIKM